ncbi:MAG: hypothetical protein K9I02_03000 [Haliscomenobacter sp.]|nr:hypothetical protein [Haliscomenobacter sp.]
MRKYQRLDNDTKSRLIDTWHLSGLTQIEFCKREGLCKSTFGSWLRKCGKGQTTVKSHLENTKPSFLPVNLYERSGQGDFLSGQVTINYPNGVQVSCPASIEIDQLKSLISI